MGYEEEKRAEFKRKWKEKAEKVKIGLIGQPGAGKSSLINKMIGKKIFESGVHTDTTVEMKKACYGSLEIVDLPGYGTKTFPVKKWVADFHPEKLDLYIYVFDGKLHESDSEVFQLFKEWRQTRKHPYFIVRNKSDEIWDDEKSLDELREEISKDVCSHIGDNTTNVFFTSCRQNKGIDILKKAIEEEDMLGVKRSKMTAAFKAESMEDLDKKKAIALDDISTYAYMAAANALNPIPGVDVSVDVGVLYKMFADIRHTFKIDDDDEAEFAKYKLAAPLVNKVFSYATTEGITALLKQVASKYITKEVTKYIPFFGQALSAVAGYKLTDSLGTGYVDDCYKLAESKLDEIIKTSGN